MRGLEWGRGLRGGRARDVTGDVLGLTLDHSRDLLRDRIPAARVEMELRNGDHRYSPPNGRSPLAGTVKLGRKLWVRAAYPFDGFSNTRGTRLAEHSPDYDDGFTWSEHSGGFEIGPTGIGARTSHAAGEGRCAATVDFGDADVSFGCDFTRGGGTAHGGLCFRYSDADNFLYVRVTGSAVEVRKVEGGADSLLASASHAWASGVRGFLQVELHGASIRVFVGLDAVVEAESSFNNMGATRHGPFSEGQADHLWESFGGWVSLFHGGIDSILPRPGRGGAVLLRAGAGRDGAYEHGHALHLRLVGLSAAVGPHPGRHSRLRGCGRGQAAVRRGLDPGAAHLQPGHVGREGPGRDVPAAGRGGRLHLRGRTRLLAPGGARPQGCGPALLRRRRSSARRAAGRARTSRTWRGTTASRTWRTRSSCGSGATRWRERRPCGRCRRRRGSPPMRRRSFLPRARHTTPWSDTLRRWRGQTTWPTAGEAGSGWT